MNGPCLCGDPYCGSCGDPAAARLEDAEQHVMDSFNEKGFSCEEYKIALIAGIAAVEAHREALKVMMEERQRLEIEDKYELNLIIEELRRHIAYYKETRRPTP